MRVFVRVLTSFEGLYFDLSDLKHPSHASLIFDRMVWYVFIIC